MDHFESPKEDREHGVDTVDEGTIPAGTAA
jgi:hypothetical protein